MPMLIFAWIIYWLDRYEKEPGLLLGVVFVWGALIAAGVAFFVNSILGAGVYLVTQSEATANLATGTLIAPVVEEALKGIAVLVVFLLARREFDSLLDGVIYAAIVALGFAATENTYYIYEYGFKPASYAGLVWIAFVRIFLVGWQHPFYTAFLGIGLAVSRLSKDNAIRLLAPLGGFAAAVILHSSHNTLGSLLQDQIGLAVEAIFDWSGWSLMFLFILWAITRERLWIVKHLREEITLGTITVAQYRAACSTWGRSRARWKALTQGNFGTTSRFYQVCSELAYKKQQLLSLGEEGGNSQVIETLREELGGLSSKAQT
jgi:RsiW-degrading membrane proteinase PrsW (M82 family)